MTSGQIGTDARQTSATGARRALVTGASRGIGKATAVALARAGFDVAVAARTMHEGDGVEEGDATGADRPTGATGADRPTGATGADRPTGRATQGRATQGRVIEGSVETTCALVEAEGRRTLGLAIDLLDHASLATAVEAVEREWGGVDLLVNNAVHTGPGSMTHVMDLDPATLRTKFEANVIAQVVLVQAVVPGMLEHGGGMIVNVTSAVALSDPAVPAGQGGWGFGYAMSKGAFHRLAGILAVELGESGIVAFNLEPGFVMTERMERNAAGRGFEGRYRGAPPSVPAAVIAWLATDPAAAAFNGQTIRAQKVALERSLHPDWRS